LHRFWTLPSAASSVLNDADVDSVKRAEMELQTAVSQHMVSDVPVGVFLSGGIDSSAIAAMAARGGSSKIKTFNIGFDEARFDESQHAKAVAAALGTEHHEVRLSQSHFRSNLHEALSSLAQPTFDAVNTYFISRAVREAGITVALAGTGGDELFGGYRSFSDLPRAAAWSRRCRWLPESALHSLCNLVARVKYGAPGEIPPQTRWGKLGDGLCTRGKLLDLYQTAYSMFTVDFQRELMNGVRDPSVRCGLPREVAQELAAMTNGHFDLHSISMLELSCYIGERLLRDTDCASMAVSLEARVPLLDHQVVEAVAGVNEHTRFHPLGQKRLLRQIALRDLDPALFDRPKSGFELPIELWCREELAREIESAFNDQALIESIGLSAKATLALWRAFKARAPGVYWSRVWSIFVLLWWCKSHRIAA
jgi:asparagine synthase (glutamine-hydrolysing)